MQFLKHVYLQNASKYIRALIIAICCKNKQNATQNEKVPQKESGICTSVNITLFFVFNAMRQQTAIQ